MENFADLHRSLVVLAERSGVLGDLGATLIDPVLRFGFAGVETTGQVIAHGLVWYGALPTLARQNLRFVGRGILTKPAAVNRWLGAVELRP